MNERIGKLLEMCMAGELYHQAKSVQYDRMDLLLEPVEMSAKRLCEYMLAQSPVLTEYHSLLGNMNFDGTVEADAFTRIGHKNEKVVMDAFFLKTEGCPVSPDAQHATPDYKYVLHHGLEGVLQRIEASRQNHTGKDELLFLNAEEKIILTLIQIAQNWSDLAAAKAEGLQNPEYRQNLLKLSEGLKHVPHYPARSFYEAVLCVSFLFFTDPDSIGLCDRYLLPYYRKDIEDGVLSRDEAKAILQELFLQIQSWQRHDSAHFTRGGECHFAVGGYTEDGEDGFNELSHLIVESLMELPIYKPQISLRWTKKTPRSVLRYMLDCERKDPHKRIAFVSDEAKVRSLMEHARMPYELAVSYTTVGCNEVVVPGCIDMTGGHTDFALCLQNIFHGNRRENVLACKTFDEFYAIFEEELLKSMEEVRYWCDRFNAARGRDVNLLSSYLYDGSIETACSITQGGAIHATNALQGSGQTTLYDSISVVKQFVYDEKRVTMEQLLEALSNNWEGYEWLHTMIEKKARYFGNHDELSDGVARRINESFYQYIHDKTDSLGRNYLMGNLIGYRQYQVFFGKQIGATPDGRYAGDPTSFGLGQTDGRDREGVSALLTSVATCDPHRLFNASSVTNVLLDAKLVKEEEYFERLVTLFETYFQQGGSHFQLTYVSREDLVNAKAKPDDYKSLRVRVSGFSEYFVRLQEDLQDDIIYRTEHAG